MVRAALVLSLVLGCVPALAFDEHDPDLRLARRHHRLSPAERERLESEVRRKIETFLTVELSSRLGLYDATALKLADAIRTHREQQHQAHVRMREESEKLSALLRDGASDDALRAQTAKVLAAAASRPEPHDLARETAKFLTAQQQAKLVLAFPEVMRDVRKMMREARGGRRGPPPRR